ncbi:hypothetical protein METP3_03225 [Methanosarcinales archaeon]|nr:hypothetical protein METP3_03225 [Methanosarcinales archaeon]
MKGFSNIFVGCMINIKNFKNKENSYVLRLFVEEQT